MSQVALLNENVDQMACGFGTLVTLYKEKNIQLPLVNVDIQAKVIDRISEVTIRQTFQNLYSEALEATYIFPMPGSSAVSQFEMQIGNRIIKGVLKERGEARKNYQQALEQGKRTALMEQERDNVFTMQVGNILPQEEVTVRLIYSEKLPFFEDGSTEIRLPLVVAPRYIPGTPQERDTVGQGVESDTDIVPDASRISPPRLAPGFDPKVNLNIEVELLKSDAGWLDLGCSQHAIQTHTNTDSIKVTLARENERLNRDFVLRWRLAGEKERPTLVYHQDKTGMYYGMLTLLPPKQEGFLGLARDVIFVVDRSGSMEGIKMASAARACSLLLQTLGPRDRFAIQAFDHAVEWLNNGQLQVADEAGIENGNRYLRKIEARGGTELDSALNTALSVIRETSDERQGRVPIIVLLTDGEIGDESRVLKSIQQRLGLARVFTVGIDTAVNEGFLKRLANLGGGTSTFVTPGERLEEALSAIGREIGNPLIVDLQVQDGKSQINQNSLAPARIPDLFAGRATTVFFQAKELESVKIRGRYSDGNEYTAVIEARPVELSAITQLWARTRVVDLEDQFRLENQDKKIKEQIIDLALQHTILTRFTAFVAVDEAEIANKDGHYRSLIQPVEMPDSWARDGLYAPAMPMPGGGNVGFASLGTTGALPPEELQLGDVFEDLSLESVSDDYDLFSSSNKAPEAPLPPSSRKSMAPISKIFGHMQKKEKAKPSDLPDISTAFKKLGSTFQQAVKNLEVNQIPSAASLESAYKALLDLLAGSTSAQELPLLQRFLRTEMAEVLAALKTPAIKVSTLKTIFDRHQKALEAAQKELESKESSRPGAFWESNI